LRGSGTVANETARF